jgi:uncharacterized membrane protein YkoI
MKPTTNIFKTVLVAGTFAVFSGAVSADDDDIAEARAIAGAAGLISLEQATEIALKAKPGTVVDVEIDRRTWPQGWDYEFEIIDKEGREWDVDIDAKTGEVRRVRQDWF